MEQRLSSKASPSQSSPVSDLTTCSFAAHLSLCWEKYISPTYFFPHLSRSYFLRVWVCTCLSIRDFFENVFGEHKQAMSFFFFLGFLCIFLCWSSVNFRTKILPHVSALSTRIEPHPHPFNPNYPYLHPHLFLTVLNCWNSKRRRRRGRINNIT